MRMSGLDLGDRPHFLDDSREVLENAATSQSECGRDLPALVRPGAGRRVHHLAVIMRARSEARKVAALAVSATLD